MNKIDDLFIAGLPSLDEDKQPQTEKYDNFVARKNLQLLAAGISITPRKERDRNKYVPHQGKKEILRRQKRLSASVVSKPAGLPQ